MTVSRRGKLLRWRGQRQQRQKFRQQPKGLLQAWNGCSCFEKWWRLQQISTVYEGLSWNSGTSHFGFRFGLPRPSPLVRMCSSWHPSQRHRSAVLAEADVRGERAHHSQANGSTRIPCGFQLLAEARSEQEACKKLPTYGSVMNW